MLGVAKMDAQLVLLGKIVLGLCAAAGLWFGVRPAAAGGSGWGSLNGQFGVDVLPEGERFSAVSGAMGRGVLTTHSRGLWTLVVNRTGFGLSILSVFGKAPAIFIPWSCVELAEERRIPFTSSTTLRIRGQSASICLYGTAGQVVAQTYRRTLNKVM